MMPLFHSAPQASHGHSSSFPLCSCCQKQAEWFFLSDCVELFYKSLKPLCQRSIILVLSCAYWFDMSPAQKSVMVELVISHFRGEAVCLRFSLHLSLCFTVYVLWRYLVKTGSQRGVEKSKRRMTSHSCTQRSLLLALQGEKHNMRALILPQAASVVISPPPLMVLLERMFSRFFSTPSFLSLYIK